MSNIDRIVNGRVKPRKPAAAKKVKPRPLDVIKKGVVKAKDKLLELQRKYLPSKTKLKSELKSGGLTVRQAGAKLRTAAPHGKEVEFKKPKWVRLP